MTDELTDERRALDGIRNLVRVLRLSERDAERSHGITSAQLFVLHQIGKQRGISLGELARLTATDQSSVSQVVRKLEEAALVTRSWAVEDQRRAELTVTPAGTRLLKKAGRTAPERLVEAIRELTPARKRHLADALAVVVEAMGAHLDAPPMLFEEPSRGRKK